MTLERIPTLVEMIKDDISRFKAEREELERKKLENAQRGYDICEGIDERLGISASLRAACEEVKGLHVDAKFNKQERPVAGGKETGWSVLVSWNNDNFQFGARIVDGEIFIISDDYGLGPLDPETVTDEQLREALFRGYKKPRGSAIRND